MNLGPPHHQSKATLTVLGSGSGMPQSERNCSGYLIDVDGQLTLLDCGSGIARAVQASGFRLTELDRVVISHTHPDHVVDLPLLIQHCHLSGKTTPLDIFVPEEFVAPLNQIIRAMYVIPERFKFEVRIQGYSEGTIIEHPMQIKAIANSHFKSYAADIERLELPNRMQAHSLKVNLAGRSVFYSGDLGNFDDVSSVMSDTDLVILETSHVDLVKMGEFVGKHPSTQFILTHITPGESIQPLNDLVRLFTNVQIAKDGMRVDVGGRT